MATSKGVPAYIIFSNKVLESISAVKPISGESLLSINGIGNVKYRTVWRRNFGYCKRVFVKGDKYEVSNLSNLVPQNPSTSILKPQTQYLYPQCLEPSTFNPQAIEPSTFILKP